MFKEAFNHVRGIRPYKIENLFARVFRPTLVLFVFAIINTVYLVVKKFVFKVVGNWAILV